ncbi:MAG: hypothetical protein ACK417_02505 [Bacteroidia bacterium]
MSFLYKWQVLVFNFNDGLKLNGGLASLILLWRPLQAKPGPLRVAWLFAFLSLVELVGLGVTGLASLILLWRPLQAKPGPLRVPWAFCVFVIGRVGGFGGDWISFADPIVEAVTSKAWSAARPLGFLRFCHWSSRWVWG